MMRNIQARPPSIFLARLFYFPVAVFLFIALLNNQWEPALLGFLILGMVAGTTLWSRMGLKKLHVKPLVAKNKVFPCDPVPLKVVIENAKMLPVAIQLQVAVDGLSHPSIKENCVSRESWLLSYQKLEFTWELTTQHRGVHAVGPFGIRGGDLLGFFSDGREFDDRHQIIVYPRLRQLRPIDLPRRDFFGMPGAKHPVEDPIYLLGTQNYQYSRPAKFIHWKASARLNRLQEKLCEPSAQEKVLMVIDVAQFVKRGAVDAFEEMLEAAASLAVHLDRRGVAIGLVTNAKTFENTPATLPVAQAPDQLPNILETMARMQMQIKAKMEDILLSAIRPSAGLSHAHFSYHRLEETLENQCVLELLKIPGAYFICDASNEDKNTTYPLQPNVYFLNDVWIQTDRCR